MRSHLQGCALKLQTVKSHQAMAEAMQTTGKAMAKMNKAVNVSTISKMMVEFEKENAKAEMMQEVMGDAIDDAMEGEDAEEEEDRIVGQLLDEIGITFGEELPEAAGMRLCLQQRNQKVPPKWRRLPVGVVVVAVELMAIQRLATWRRD